MFDFLLNEEYIYSFIGVVGVSLFLFLGKFIAAKTKTTKDDEFIRKLQEIHANSIKNKKEKAVNKVKETIDNKLNL